MNPLEFILSLSAISILAGMLGSLVGLGGGIIIVPVLTLLYHVDIHLAIGASLLSVIATSSGAAITYVQEKITNLRTGMFLEIATTLGAVTGAFITVFFTSKTLSLLFALVLIYSLYAMIHTRNRKVILTKSTDSIANYFKLHGSYYDESLKSQITYKVTHTKIGLALMYVAGVVSALLGVGSGTLKVAAMDVAMHMPIKASSATSDFMIGVTAAASAGIYFSRGQINPYIAAPVVIGVLIGAMIGARLLGKIPARYIRVLFITVLMVVTVEMIQKGIS